MRNNIPITPIRHSATVYGYRCLISGVEFIDPNMSDNEKRNKAMWHAHAIMHEQDTVDGVYTPRDRRLISRQALYRGQQNA